MPQPEPARTIVSAEVRLIRDFHESVMETMRVVRATANARGAKEPEYPTGTDQMRALLERVTSPR